MRIDCHVHTCRYSGCSSIEPDELCRLALERGLDAVALTEHRLRWPADELDDLRRRFPGLALYSGVEITLREGFDVVCIAPPELDPFPAYPDLGDLMEFVAPARERSFLFLAHAFRYEDALRPEHETLMRVVDGLETNSVNIMKHQLVRRGEQFQSSRRELYDAARARFELAPIFNTDAHNPMAIGALCSELPGVSPPPDEAALAALLKRERAVERQNKELLARFMARYSLDW